MSEHLPKGFTPLNEEDVPAEIRVRFSFPSPTRPTPGPPGPGGPQYAPNMGGWGSGPLPSLLGNAAVGAGQTALGAGLGALIGGPPGALIGGMVGGGTSPFTSQALGLQKEVTPLDVGLGALPMPGAAAMRGATRMFLPGIEPGLQQGVNRSVQAIGIKGLGPLAEKSLPGVSSTGEIVARGPFGSPLRQFLNRPQSIEAATLYAEAERLAPGVRISTAKVKQAAKDLMKEEAGVVKPLRVPGVEKARKAAKEVSFGQTMGITNFNSNTRRVGQLFRESREVFARTGEGGEKARALGRVYGSMIEAFDDAAKTAQGQPAITALRRANEAYKREIFADELQSLITKAIQPVAGQPSFIADQVIKHLLPGEPTLEILTKLVPKGEIDDLMRTLQRLAAVPGLGAELKGGVAGMPFPKRALVQGAVGAAGFMQGGLGTAAGGVIATEALFQVLGTSAGRAIARAIAGSPKLTGPLAPAVYDQLVNVGMAMMRAKQVQMRESIRTQE